MLNRYYRKKFDTEKRVKETSILTRREKGAEDSSIIFHEVIPGIELTYNFFYGKTGAEAESCLETREMIEVNHCRQGRFGCKIEKNGYVYLGAGEIGANILGVEKTNCEFPLGFYEGISILIYVPKATKSLEQMFPDLARQIKELKTKIEENDGIMMIRNIPELSHVFEELYHTDPQIQTSYIKLKVLEIILTMNLIPYDRTLCVPEYYKRVDMEKIKAIRNEAVGQLENRIPLKELAEKYDISLTNAKLYFKELYGEPYFSYLKKYRMHKAIHYLEESENSIAEIAGKLGYDNPSKFSSAFRSVVGCTPREYKNNLDHLEHLKLFGVEID